MIEALLVYLACLIAVIYAAGMWIQHNNRKVIPNPPLPRTSVSHMRGWKV